MGTRRTFLKTVVAASATATGAGCLGSQEAEETGTGSEPGSGEPDETHYEPSPNLTGVTATMHTTPACACCGAYADYFADETGAEVEKEVYDDTTEVKQELGVPSALVSCHTLEVEVNGRGRLIEGHIPVEAVEKMADTDVEMVAMPGMPAGSPGMGGSKQGPFKIYSVEDDGSYEVFAEV